MLHFEMSRKRATLTLYNLVAYSRECMGTTIRRIRRQWYREKSGPILLPPGLKYVSHP